MTDDAKKEYLVVFFGIGQFRNTIIAFDNPHVGGQLYGRSYEDESEMVKIANGVLPDGGDLGNAMHFVKRTEGWQTHVWLTISQAKLLGYGLPV
jgi:hypothetical protein